LVLLFPSKLTAQEEATNSVKHQLGIRHDNDFFVLTDRYYSFGLFLTYKHRLSKGVFGSEYEQLGFRLGVEAFTPDDTSTELIEEMDRPYAGYLGLNSGWSLTTPENFLNIELELGLAGKSSGAGAFQRWYHNAVVVSDPQSWVAELSDTFHMNLYARYAREWQLAPNPFGVRLAVKPEVAYGSRDQFIQPEVVAYFGRRSDMNSSIAYNQIGSTEREIFFAFRFAYRWVGYNGLLVGNAFGDDSVYLVEPLESYYRVGFDFKHRFKQNDYIVSYRFHSDETSMTQTHQYLILSYARSF
jgi:hypothetical protein